jgi:uncharacterized membrane protein YhfC
VRTFFILLNIALLLAAEPLCIHLWRRKTGAEIMPFFIGIVVYLCVSFIRAPLRLSISRDDAAFYYLAAGLLTAVLEECGRYIAFKKFVDYREGRVGAVSYGIGHSLLEDFGQAMVLFNSIGVAADTDDITLGVSLFFTAGTLLSIVGGLGFHISMSVLIYCGVHEDKARYVLPAAIALHTLGDQPFIRSNVALSAVFIIILCFIAYKLYICLPQKTE